MAVGLRRAISAGRYPPESPLPPYRELAETYGVSIATISEACGQLEEEGLVVRETRRGVFTRANAFSQPETLTAPPLQCVTFVSSFFPTNLGPVHLREEYLAGYSEALEQEFIKMRFASITREVASFAKIVSPAVPRYAQGCVLVQCISPTLMKWLQDRDMPFVVQEFAAYHQEGAPPHHKVVVNKRRGVMDAASYLVGLGHTRIGFFGRFKRELGTPGARATAGFLEVLRRSGLELRPEDIEEEPAEIPEQVIGRATRFLDRPDRPTAVMAMNDAMAIGIIRAARSLGLRVPGDLSVVGFNDEPEAATCDPPLTTVSNPRRALARRAVELLLETSAHPGGAYRAEALECHLVVRSSAAAPSKT